MCVCLYAAININIHFTPPSLKDVGLELENE